jgi:CarD family transcriptional regulator
VKETKAKAPAAAVPAVVPAKPDAPKAAPAAKPAAAAPAKTTAAKAAKGAKAAPPAPPAPVLPPQPLVQVKAAERPPAATKPVEKPVATAQPKFSAPAARPAGALPAGPAPVRVKINFAVADHVVYPTHGVGRIVRIDRQEIAGFQLELLVVEFEKDKLTVSVPVAKAASVGMRRLSSPQQMRTALETLKGRARIKRAMWSRRAQEYEAKINSGDPVSIAEVVRDLHRNAGQPDQSYSERQIYEKALDRLAHELAAVEKIDDDTAAKRLEKMLKAA